jgi:phage-related protein
MAGEPYFIWKGVDSRLMRVWVQKYPPITRPPERYQEVTIPGRPGSLTLLEGVDVYEPYVREMRIMPKPGADIYEIMRWLKGKGEVVFGCEPDRKQVARIYDEAAFERVFADQRSATVRFLCDPFKKLLAEETISVDLSRENYTLACKGDVISYPQIEFVGTGTVSLFVNSNEMSFSGLTLTPVTVDCEARQAYTYVTEDDVTKIVPIVTHGDYPTFYNTGTMLIRWTTGISALTIKPRWRWF